MLVYYKECIITALVWVSDGKRPQTTRSGQLPGTGATFRGVPRGLRVRRSEVLTPFRWVSPCSMGDGGRLPSTDPDPNSILGPAGKKTESGLSSLTPPYGTRR